MARRCGSFAVLLLLAVAGCRHLPWGGRALAECPGALVPTDAIAGEFLLRQAARVRAPGIDFPLELAIQKRGGELAVIGISPFGAVLFRAVQTGREARVASALPPAVLPVPPLNLLRDIHRARFLTASRPEGGEGIAVAERDGTLVTERWRDGRRVDRVLERLDARRRETVRVRFVPGDDPPAVLVENEPCGYRLELQTLSEETLP